MKSLLHKTVSQKVYDFIHSVGDVAGSNLNQKVGISCCHQEAIEKHKKLFVRLMVKRLATA